jgi:hypothetical protein
MWDTAFIGCRIVDIWLHHRPMSEAATKPPLKHGLVTGIDSMVHKTIVQNGGVAIRDISGKGLRQALG